MKPEEFTKWLSEMLTFHSGATLNESQTAILKQKLNSVFNKVTPTVPSNNYLDGKKLDFGQIMTGHIPFQIPPPIDAEYIIRSC